MKFNKQEKTYRLQQLYAAALSSLKHYQQQDNLQNISLQLGRHLKTVHLKIPVMFVIGDNQGGDAICGCHIHYGKTARRISQTCNAGPEHLSNPTTNSCTRLIMTDVANLVHKENGMSFMIYIKLNIGLPGLILIMAGAQKVTLQLHVLLKLCMH